MKASAFTLIQLIVSLGILAVLALVLVNILMQGSDQQRLARLRIQLSQENRELEKRLKEDIEQAVRISGETGEEFAGISTLYDEPPDDWTDPGDWTFQIYQQHFGNLQLSGAIEYDSSTDDAHLKIFGSENSGPDEFEDEFEFFLKGAGVDQSSIYDSFLINSSKATNLIKIGDIVDNGNSQVLEIEVDNSGDYLSTLAAQHSENSSNFVRAARRIEYTRDDSGQLIRREIYADIDNHPRNREEVVANNIEEIEILYEFANNRPPEENIDLIIPAEPIPHIEYGPYFNENNCDSDTNEQECVQWQDVVNIQIEMTSSTEMASIKNPPEQMMGGRYQIEEDQLLYTTQNHIVPTNYLFMPGSGVGSAEALECLPFKAHRCDPDCTEIFTENWNGTGDPPSNWEGYGRPVGAEDLEASGHWEKDEPSEYCRCGQETAGDEFVIPEENWNDILPSGGWTVDFVALDESKQEQITACGEHFNGWEVRREHPGYQLALRCLQPLEDFYQEEWPYRLKNPNGAEGNGAEGFEAFKDYWPTNEDSFKDATAPWFDSEKEQYKDLRCFYGSDIGHPAYCANQLNRLFGWELDDEGSPGDGEWWKLDDHDSPWRQKCACLNFEEDENGDPIHGEKIGIHRLDFRLLCNLNMDDEYMMGFGESGQATPVCENTWNAGAYLVRSGDDNPQGFPNEERAALCECFKARDVGEDSEGSNVSLPALYNPADLNSSSDDQANAEDMRASIRSWDFRQTREDLNVTDSGVPDVKDSPIYSEYEADFNALEETRKERLGSHLSYSVGEGTAYEYEVDFGSGSSETGTELACNRAYGKQNAGLSRCTQDYSSTEYINDDVLEQFQETHSRYCKNGCYNGTASDTKEEIEIVRRLITGTAPDADLPLSCGGEEEDSGGGDGGNYGT